MNRHRIISNLTFWQSPTWTRETDSIYDLDQFKKKPEYKSAFWEAWQLFKKRRKYDLVMTMNARTSLYYGLLCKCSGVRSKQVMTEIFFDEARPSNLVWRCKTLLYRWVAQSCMGVICNSTAEVTLTAERLQIAEERIVFLPLHANICEPKKYPRGDYILAAGRSQRDYQTCIKALENVNFPTVIICGQEDVRGLSIPEHVTVYKELSYSDYLEKVKHCAFMVLPLRPSVRSTGQVVMLDAMSFGKPVIASRVVGTVDYIQDGVNGVTVPPEDPAALQKTCERFIKDFELSEKLGEQAFNDVLQKYSPEKHGELRLKCCLRWLG